MAVHDSQGSYKELGLLLSERLSLLMNFGGLAGAGKLKKHQQAYISLHKVAFVIPMLAHRTQYNTIQYKNEYYYSGINPMSCLLYVCVCVCVWDFLMEAMVGVWQK